MITTLTYKSNDDKALKYATNMKTLHPDIIIKSCDMGDKVQLSTNNILYQGYDSVNSILASTTQINYPTNILSNAKLISDIPPAVNVFINFHITPSADRNKEILAAMKKNVDDVNVSKLYVIRDKTDKHKIKSVKIVDIILDKRPTYRDIMDNINNVTQPDDVNVIMNSDCFFNYNFIQVIENIKHNECYTLNRMEITDVNDLTSISRMVGTTDSQDGWVFRGTVNVEGGNFYLGIPGCDNKMCYQAHISSYELINPLKSDIYLYHYHTDAYRSYNEHTDRLPHPYALVSESTVNTPSHVGILG